MSMLRRFAVDDLRVVLRQSGFRQLFVTRLASQTCDGAFEAALAGLFFFSPQRSATAGGIAAAFTAAILPYTLVGPFAGVLLDRWRRRQVLVSVNLIRAVLVLMIATLLSAGVVGLRFYIVVLACLSVNRFFLSGLGAGLPHVVPDHQLVMANAISTTFGGLAALLGSGLAIAFRTRFGSGDETDAAILTAAAIGYLLSAVLATRMHPELLGPPQRPAARWVGLGQSARSVLIELGEALHQLRTHATVLAALLVLGAQRFAYGLITVATFLLCRSTYADADDPDSGVLRLAAVFAVSGAGFFLAAVITPIVTRHLSSPAWMVSCCLGAGLIGAIFAMHPSYRVLVACAGVLALALQSTKICVDALVQGGIGDAHRGRVLSLYDMAYNATFVAAAALCALILPPSGLSEPLFVAVATVFVVTGLVYARTTAQASSRGPADPAT